MVMYLPYYMFYLEESNKTRHLPCTLCNSFICKLVKECEALTNIEKIKCLSGLLH